ncbi:MAG: acyltransferase [Chitinophagaceae bacterium]|nr:acyltransferase [Chitinophagaceae bacterium]
MIREVRGRPLEDIIASDKQNNFQLLRLIAAVMVMENHSHLLLYDKTRDAYNSLYFHISHLGLPSFFFLSGLLVTQSLDHSSSWKHFLWKRILRIYPAACLSVLAAALIMGPVVTTLPLKEYFLSPLLYRYLATCSLLHISFLLPGVFSHSVLGSPAVNASLWTVSMELKLYIGLLLTWQIPVVWRKRLWPPLIIAAIVCYTWKVQYIPVFYRPWFTFGVQFLSGTLCYHYKDKIIIPSYGMILIPLLILFSIWLHIWLYTAYLLIPALVICAGAFAVPWIKKITPKPDLSYGIYVFAFPVQQLVANYLHPAGPLQMLTLSLIAVCPLAILSWYAVEKKALQLKDRIPS